MGYRDVSQLLLADVYALCKKYSRRRSKVGKGLRDPMKRVTKSAYGGVTRDEIGNLLEDFKIDSLGTISSQLDTLN